MQSSAGAGETRRRLLELCSQGKVGTAYVWLLDGGFDASLYPGLWELLERHAEEAGDAGVAHRARCELLGADVAHDDIALKAAQYEIERDQPEKARAHIEKCFGPDPENEDARILLGVSLAGHDKNTALLMLENAEDGSQAVLLAAVDALRGMGEIRRARQLCEAALVRFPGEAVFTNRMGWIAEAMGDYETARNLVAAELTADGDGRVQALNRLVRLQRRLGNRTEAIAHAAELLRLEAPPLQKLRLAVALGQQRLLQQLVAKLPVQYAEGILDSAGAERIVALLMAEGHIGLALFLWREGLPIGEAEKRLLQRRVLGDGSADGFPNSFEEAFAIRSPAALFPLRPYASPGSRQDRWHPAFRPTDRVLLVNPVLAAGGAERQFLMAIRSLLAAGVDPLRVHAALFSLERDRGHGHFEDTLRNMGIHVHDLAAFSPPMRTMPEVDRDIVALLPTKLRDDVARLWHLVRSIEPAVIHGWQDRAAMAAGLVGHMLGTRRVVLSARNMRPSKRGDTTDWIARSVYLELLRSPAVAMTANASEAARDYEDWLQLPKGTVSLLPNAIDVSMFSPIPGKRSSKGPVRILGVFRLAENKRPILWLETIAALRRIHGLEVAPRIVGAGPMADEIMHNAERLGLADLRLDPPVPNPSDIYRQSDALLLMSRVEGTPNVVLEAQACGLPVAACRVGGVPEALHLGGESAGLLLDPESGAEDAAAALAQWLPQALCAPRDPRVAFVNGRFSMVALAQNLLGLYGAPS